MQPAGHEVELSRARREDVRRCRNRLVVVTDRGIRLVVEDGLDKIVLVREVVVKLRSAYIRRGLDVFKGGASHAALID